MNNYLLSNIESNNSIQMISNVLIFTSDDIERLKYSCLLDREDWKIHCSITFFNKICINEHLFTSQINKLDDNEINKCIGKYYGFLVYVHPEWGTIDFAVLMK